MRIWGNHRITTFQIIALGFALMILAGTLLLMLPFSSRQQTGTGFADCLFTAASAVCVTGLVVRDTAAHWSAFGQAVILLLIQVGGMGVVTAAVSLSFLSDRRIGLMQRSVMQDRAERRGHPDDVFPDVFRRRNDHQPGGGAVPDAD